MKIAEKCYYSENVKGLGVHVFIIQMKHIHIIVEQLSYTSPFPLKNVRKLYNIICGMTAK